MQQQIHCQIALSAEKILKYLTVTRVIHEYNVNYVALSEPMPKETLINYRVGELLCCAVLVISTYYYICFGSCAPCALRFIPHRQLISVSLSTLVTNRCDFVIQ